MQRVLVADAKYEAIDGALDRVFEEFPLEVSGKTVLLKPNMLGCYVPESHVNTSPELVKALVERFRSAGGEVIVADNPGARGYGLVEKSGEVSGLSEAAMGAFKNISLEVEAVELPHSGVTVNVSRIVRQADVLVSVPKFKTHTLTGISGAIKNSFGFVVGGDKARMHRELGTYRDFSRMLVGVYQLRVPDLVIMDGVVGMEGNGPSGKDLYPVGKVLASDNGVALDAVMARMMGMRPEKIEMLEFARAMGLGETDISRIEVVGNGEPLSKFRRPMSTIPRLIPGALMERFYPDLDRPRFDIDPDACNSCRNCADICPGGAIAMEDGRPSYDYSKCISCYCCMELCPRQAIELHDSFRVRVYRRLGIL